MSATIIRPICGTPQGYSKHCRMNEPRCNECRDAQRLADNERKGTRPRVTIQEVAEEIEHLLSLNQGYGYIISAIGYTGREGALEARLRRNGHADLYNRLAGDYKAAA